MEKNVMREIIKRNRESLGLDGNNDKRFIDSFVAVNKEVTLQSMSEYFNSISDAYPIIADGLLIGYEQGDEVREYDFAGGAIYR